MTEINECQKGSEGKGEGKKGEEKDLQSKPKSETESRNVRNIKHKHAEGCGSFSYYHISISCWQQYFVVSLLDHFQTTAPNLSSEFL